jgi:hypothetical protein
VTRGEPGGVWLERVRNDLGDPMSTIPVGEGDNGLWRVRSEEHGTQFVVSHAEALSVADRLAGRDPWDAKYERRDPGPAPADRFDRSRRHRHDEARRTQSNRGERHSR